MMLRIAKIGASVALVCATANILEASTVTYQIDIDGATGMFDAPQNGGLLTSFAITLDGVLFDTLGSGSSAPVYSAINNDIRGNPSTEAAILNSVAGLGCPVLSCILSLEDSVDPGVIPPLFAVFPFIDGIPGTVTNSGEYSITPPTPISPVPLPAPLLLLVGGLAALLGLCRLPRQASLQV